MKKFLWIPLIIILWILCYLAISRNHRIQPPTNVSVCTMEYTPVCAKTYLSWYIPVVKTFSNLCTMEAEKKDTPILMTFLYSWECIKNEPQKSWDNYILTTNTTDKYKVKTEEGQAIAWQSIYVYDTSGNNIYSLPTNSDMAPQRYIGIAWNNIIAEYSTSPDGDFSIYNIPMKQKIFSSKYHSVNTWVWIENNTVKYHAPVWIQGNDIATKPENAPVCTGIDDGYIQLMTFDLTTKQITNTWALQCTYFQ